MLALVVLRFRFLGVYPVNNLLLQPFALSITQLRWIKHKAIISTNREQFDLFGFCWVAMLRRTADLCRATWSIVSLDRDLQSLGGILAVFSRRVVYPGVDDYFTWAGHFSHPISVSTLVWNPAAFLCPPPPNALAIAETS